MQKDYSVTIFSRKKGKTRTFNLNRRTVVLPLVLAVVLALGCFLFGQAYFQEREERQLLESRIALLEQQTDEFDERSENQGGDSLAEPSPEAVNQPTMNVAKIAQKEGGGQKAQAVQADVSSQTPADLEPATLVEIDDPKANSLEQDSEGFKLTFKLANVTGELVAGHVAIIASLRQPHKPRYVSFPSMKLVDGRPVKLRKTVGFSIRYFKYVTGRFSFPFSYSESFRILVYNRDEKVILDSTVLAEDVNVGDFLTEQLASSKTPAVEDVPASDSVVIDSEQPTTDSSVQNSQ